MPDQKQPGGSGPYLTKDAFYVAMNQMRDRQDANKQEVLIELRRVSDEWKEDCNDDIGKLEDRVRILEAAQRSAKVLTAAIAGGAGVVSATITAIVVYFTKGG